MREQPDLDLRGYVRILMQHWKLVVGAALVAASAALVVSLLVPPKYVARAGVVIVKYKSVLSLDSRFVTLSEEELAAAGRQEIWNLQARRRAFADLVGNGAIAEQVIAELGELLDPKQRQPATLLEIVKGTVDSSSDLIRITVSDRKPDRAEAIANAWARIYEQQVNSAFSGAAGIYPSLQVEWKKAKDEYETAEKALTAFVAENRMDELDRLIGEQQTMIDTLQEAKQANISLAVDKEQEAKRQLLEAYIDAEVSSRLAAFEKDRQARSDIFSQFVDAQVDAQKAVIDEQVQAKTQKLADCYTTKARMEQLLKDAQALHAQARAGGAASSATNSLAILLLKAQVFASSAELPGTLQLQLGTASDLDGGPEEQVADLEALSATLQQRIADLEAEISALSQELLDGTGYDFLDDVSASNLALASLLTTTAGSTMTVSASGPLGQAILQKYTELFQVGQTAQDAQEFATGTTLFAEIRKLYPELFSVDELSGLGGLPTTAGAEDQSTSTAQQPLERAIAGVESQLRQLQAQLEQETARKQELENARDLAFEAYSTLSSKSAEVGIEAAVTGSEVRFVAPAVAPARPSSPNKLLNTALGGALGFIVGVLGVFLAEYFRGAEQEKD